MNLSKNGVREFTGQERKGGGIEGIFDISWHDLEIRVDKSARKPSVQIIPRNHSEISLRVVRDAIIEQHGNRLSVSLPNLKNGVAGSTMMISESVSINNVRYPGPVTIMDGVVYSGSAATRVMNSGVLVTVTLPADSSADINSVSGDARIHGDLDDLRFHSVSGDVETGTVRTVSVKTTSGDVELSAVLEEGQIKSVSGGVGINKYDGRNLAVTTVSGGVEVVAGNRARGTITVSTVSGNITTRNTTGHPNLQVRPKTISGSVQER